MDEDVCNQIDKLYGDGKNKRMQEQVVLSTVTTNMLNNVVITDEELV